MNFYTIQIAKSIEPRWEEWFEGLSITNLENGTCLIMGCLPDQAALFSTLNKIYSLGLPLLSVETQSVS